MCSTEQRIVTDDGGSETIYVTDTCDKAICVDDFCGFTTPDHLPVQYWADWCPVSGMVCFGGDWRDVPPTPCATMPGDDRLAEIIATHRAATDCHVIKKHRRAATLCVDGAPDSR